MMKSNVWVTIIYATLLLVGGIMGYLKAGSQVSLIMGGGFAALLYVLCYLLAKGSSSAFKLIIGIQTLLLAFFSYRLYLTGKMMPAGMMIFLSVLALAYLNRNYFVEKGHQL